MPEFYYSLQARLDLLEIWKFIADRENLEIADRIEREIERTVLKLAMHPQIGHLRTDLTNHPVRFFKVYSYLCLRPAAAAARGCQDTERLP